MGAAAKTTLSATTNLRLGLEAAHRFDDSCNGVSSSAVGLPGVSFNLAGERVKRTWTRFTLDVDHRLSDSVAVTFGMNAASAGGDPSWGATAGLRANF